MRKNDEQDSALQQQVRSYHQPKHTMLPNNATLLEISNNMQLLTGENARWLGHWRTESSRCLESVRKSNINGMQAVTGTLVLENFGLDSEGAWGSRGNLLS
jgi:hypothetical protein